MLIVDADDRLGEFGTIGGRAASLVAIDGAGGNEIQESRDTTNIFDLRPELICGGQMPAGGAYSPTRRSRISAAELGAFDEVAVAGVDEQLLHRLGSFASDRLIGEHRGQIGDIE